MKIPSNRKEKVKFFRKKLGCEIADNWLSDKSDKEVKRLFELYYPKMKDKEDYKESEIKVTCIRCGCEVIHHHECNCGMDRAVFSEEDWKDDIDSNSDRLQGDEEFMKNEFKLLS
ncbi:MAG: hypothetical protein K0S47_3185 [Herbinix sp.]|jgi:hypothetical protein|nr:hypothetical protein [Herbinix sp.]